MRIYEGSPRQDFEEVFRSIGAFLDQRGMHEVLLVEAPDGFIVQGLVTAGAGRRRLVGVDGRADQGDADVPRRRHRPVHGGVASPAAASRNPSPAATPATTRRRSGSSAGTWTSRSRATSSSSSRTGRSSSACSWAASRAASTMLAEFTRDDIAEMVARGPTLRQPDPRREDRGERHAGRLTPTRPTHTSRRSRHEGTQDRRGRARASPSPRSSSSRSSCSPGCSSG